MTKRIFLFTRHIDLYASLLALHLFSDQDFLDLQAIVDIQGCGHIAFTASSDGTALLWYDSGITLGRNSRLIFSYGTRDIEVGSLMHKVAQHESGITRACMHTDSNTLYTASGTAGQSNARTAFLTNIEQMIIQ